MRGKIEKWGDEPPVTLEQNSDQIRMVLDEPHQASKLV